jgi:flagellar biosynthesis protein FlhF
MQIKRFEAEDMTEALRLVKRDFGDDAVILSAKEVRPGGFFSALRKKSVEITAATDYPADDKNVGDATVGDDFPGMLSRHLDDEPETDRVSLSSRSQTITPFFPKTPSLDLQARTTGSPVAGTERNDRIREEGLTAYRLNPPPETKARTGQDEASAAACRRYLANHHLIAEPFYHDLSRPKTIAVVGPSGSGKSSMVAKLAWRCQTVEKKRIGLISLDRFRIGANAMLERVAGIMSLPLAIVHDPEQLQSTLNDLVDADVILIDTPGIGSMDASMKGDIGTLIRSANPDETHLVGNATVREDVFAATVNAFSPLGVDHLIFTHMDEVIDSPSMLKLLEAARLPVSFFADGVDLFDGLKETTAGRFDAVSPCIQTPDSRVTTFSAKRRQIKSGSAKGGDNGDACQFVANRNSELFHHPDCKSVKRINAENITAFNSIEEAMDDGFKPCRACCDISMASKPVPATFGYRRASAI